jgi:RHS repeat-associated protein
MLQPGRSGYSVSGGWATSSTGESGTPSRLQISSRSGNGPSLYQATELIEFVGEFQSGSGDEFTAEIGGGGAGSGGNGIGSGIAGSGYRYGFNGKEQDAEVKGTGAQYDYGFRIYDPRLGKFLSVDPLSNIYPFYTPYQFAGNMPIAAIDIDGLEEYVVIYYKDQNKKTTRIQVRAIFDNDGTILNQHVHKIGDNDNIAKGNVLVFENKKAKDGKESMSVIENRNIVDGELTKEEAQIFRKHKKIEKEKGETENLQYQTDNPYKVLYQSQEFENTKTKTYKANFGIAPPSSPK